MTADHQESFGEFFLRLREGYLRWQDLADDAKCSRTTIANIVQGRSSGGETAEALKKRWPARKDEISAAFAETLRRKQANTTPPVRTPAKKGSNADDFRVLVVKYMEKGQQGAARRALIERLGIKPQPTAVERHWIHHRLAILDAMQPHTEANAEKELYTALEIAVSSELREEEIYSRQRLGSHYHARMMWNAAHEVLDAGLQRFPDAAKLWFRKGKVYWYQQEYALAYADLSTALMHGTSRKSLLHARGQVLAEWHNFDAALRDIDEYLDIASNARLINKVSLRTARAYVWGQTGRFDEAFAEFDAASRMVVTTWSLYRRGLCHWKADEAKAAITSIKKALDNKDVVLKPPRRDNALSVLRELGAKYSDWYVPLK